MYSERNSKCAGLAVFLEAIKNKGTARRENHAGISRRTFEKMIPFASSFRELDVLKTGTFLDDLTGVYGLPKGRIIEFIGPEKSGKSTASFHVIASAQKAGLRCLLIDIEHSFVGQYAEDLGVDLETLGVIRAVNAEDYIDQTLEAVNSGEWDLFVFDSIGSLSSRVELEKTAGEKQIAGQASLMSVLVRKLAPQVSLRNQIFIGVNHSRIDFMNHGKVVAMGGKAWSEKKKLSIEFKEKSGVLLKSGEAVVGKVIVVRVMKNAVGPTERKELEVKLIFGRGFDQGANLVDEAIERGILRKSGNSYFFKEEKIAVGRAKLDAWASENLETLQEALT